MRGPTRCLQWTPEAPGSSLHPESADKPGNLRDSQEQFFDGWRGWAMLSALMRLSELFSAEDVLVGFQSKDKWEAIHKLVEHLVGRGRLPATSAPQIRELVIAREKSMSTGMEHGIAIPHAAVDGVEGVVACMGIVREEAGLPFDSIDGKPARIVVLLVIPRAQKLLHIRTLADIARVLGRDAVRGALLQAGSAKDAWAALAEGDAARR